MNWVQFDIGCSFYLPRAGDIQMLVRKEPHSCRVLIKSRSMDYEGPFGLATFLSENTIPKDYVPFQSPSGSNTRREETGRPSGEGLI
jgi:hypothetical protein